MGQYGAPDDPLQPTGVRARKPAQGGGNRHVSTPPPPPTSFYHYTCHSHCTYLIIHPLGHCTSSDYTLHILDSDHTPYSHTPSQQLMSLVVVVVVVVVCRYVPNHTSFMDILVMSGFVPRPFKYLSKVTTPPSQHTQLHTHRP